MSLIAVVVIYAGRGAGYGDAAPVIGIEVLFLNVPLLRVVVVGGRREAARGRGGGVHATKVVTWKDVDARSPSFFPPTHRSISWRIIFFWILLPVVGHSKLGNISAGGGSSCMLYTGCRKRATMYIITERGSTIGLKRYILFLN